MRVLQITEAFGGGVAASINAFLRYDWMEQRAVVVARPGLSLGEEPAGDLEVHQRSNHAKHWRLMRSAVQDYRPDLVHLHSSIAGGLGRLPALGVPTVYSPRGFAFGRTDLSGTARALVRGIERTLAARTAGGGAVSPWERDQMTDLGYRLARLIPNELPPSAKTELASLRRTGRGVAHVVTVGRASPQKDPDWAIEFARHWVGDRRRMTWVGGGPPEVVGRLEAAGIRVTGWLPRRGVWEAMSEADIYLHTAAWEGMPNTLLEAIALRLPLLVRATETMAGLPLPDDDWVNSPGEAVETIGGLTPAIAAERAAASYDVFHAGYHAESQSDALQRLYESVLSG